MRILQVVQRMGRGGIETWLMHVLRNIDRKRYQFDFMVGTNQKQAYDAEIKSLGGKIIPCATPAHPIDYAKSVKKILQEKGPYDVVHCHGGVPMGFALKLSAQEHVPCRIVHGHSTSEEKGRLRSKFYRVLTRHWMEKYMTAGLGCSADACRFLFGPKWQKDTRVNVLLYGLDFSKFMYLTKRTETRQFFGIPQDATVVGHVGRFHRVKNHSFIVKVAEELNKINKNIFFMLVGDGQDKHEIESQVRQSMCPDKFIFTGETSEVASMMSAMDIFLLPSLYEGLAIVVLEAQAAGLMCIISDIVAQEIDVIPSQIKRFSLSKNAQNWAQAVLDAAKTPRPNQSESAKLVAESNFGISKCIANLTGIYEQGVGQ